MFEKDVVERVKELLQPILEERGLKLVDIELTGGANPTLRIFIYNPEGTSIEDCEWVSRRIGALLDVEDLIPSSYVLEVSSPGLERKLKHKEEFEIFKGRNIKIVTKCPIDEKNVFKGKLEGIEKDTVTIEEEGKKIEIPYEEISKAKLEM